MILPLVSGGRSYTRFIAQAGSLEVDRVANGSSWSSSLSDRSPLRFSSKARSALRLVCPTVTTAFPAVKGINREARPWPTSRSSANRFARDLTSEGWLQLPLSQSEYFDAPRVLQGRTGQASLTLFPLEVVLALRKVQSTVELKWNQYFLVRCL